ncbi:MAG: NADH-quinone oxidoreductase subunit M [Chloroflexi bacterium]|nr:MAG: NADH-quinone oxidoreductase subunit M [Chloroflexota bacterium]
MGALPANPPTRSGRLCRAALARNPGRRRPGSPQALNALIAVPLQSTTTTSQPFANVEIPTLLLSGIVWVPTIVALALLLFPDRTDAHRARLRSVALTAVGLVAALGVLMWYGFRDQGATFAYEEKRNWMQALGTSYHLGVDGVSMPVLLLSTILFLTAVLASYRVRDRVKEYFFFLLLLETGVNGVLSSLDYLLFFLFWGMQLVPAFFLIGTWGGGPRRLQVAWKYLAFGLVSSGLLLLAILVTAARAPSHTFDIPTLHDAHLPVAVATLAFFLFLGAFALQLPVFPLHTGFVDAQSEAPAPVAAVLAGVVTKLGAYGLIRVNLGEFQDVLHKFRVPLLALALLTIIWPAVAALRQDDLRRLIGYVVVSRLGFLVLATVSAQPVAVNGGVVLMVADGLSAGALIYLAASLIERTNTRSVRAMGGLASRMPRGAVLWIFAALASIGLPGLAGFVGQFLVFLGAYSADRKATTIALLGVLLTAGVLVWTIQRLFFGPLPESLGSVRDLGSLELSYTITLVSLIFLIGIIPGFMLLDNVNFGVLTLLTRGTG